jgi:hypothetical protein
MKNLIAVAAVALALMACGSTAVGPAVNPTPSPSPSSGTGFDVSVTERDHTAAMRVGQKLEVVLHAASGMNSWSPPKSTNEALLVPIVDPAATAVRGVTLGAFQARAPGQVDVNAYAGPICPSGQACPMYVVVFSLRVDITQG